MCLTYIDIPCLITFCFIVLCRYCVLNKLEKVCGNLMWNKPIGAIFPTAFAHLMSLCDIFCSFTMFQTFSVLIYWYLLWQSVTGDFDYNYLAISIFKLGYCFFLDVMYWTLNGQQYSVNITFICIGKPKIHLTCSIVTFVLLWWSGTEAVSGMPIVVIKSCKVCGIVTSALQGW